MKTDVFETDLRQALARRAAQIPGEAVQRLERLDYRPRARSRTMLAASAAAAVILLGGTGYGLTAAFAGHAAGPASTKTTALTTVNGCARLAQVTGTLEQVNGAALVIQTPGGQSVTVTTTASTRVSLSAASLSDITDGAPVRVDGVMSDGTMAAGKVAVGEPTAPGSGKPQPPGGSGQHTVHTVPGGTIIQGTVADLTSTGFTVDTSAGTRVPVTTSSSTLFVVDSASPSELQTGANTTAVGSSRPGGTLSALAIAQFPSGTQFRLTVHGCSPSSVDNAITTAFLAGG